MASDSSVIRETIDETRGKVGETAQAVAERVGDVTGRVGSGVDGVKDQAAAKLDEVTDRAGAVASRTAERISRPAQPVVAAAGTSVRRGAEVARRNRTVALALGLAALVALVVLARRQGRS